MKTLDLKSLLIGILLTMVIVAFMLIATSSTSRSWEYTGVYSGGIAIDPEVSKLGDEGWEVVGYTFAYDKSGNPRSFYVLKRAKRSSLKWKFWK